MIVCKEKGEGKAAEPLPRWERLSWPPRSLGDRGDHSQTWVGVWGVNWSVG